MVTWKVYHPDYPTAIIAHGMCLNLDPMIDYAEEIAKEIIKDHFKRNTLCDELKLVFVAEFPNGGFSEWGYVFH